MLKRIFGALLLFRLESADLSYSIESILALLRQRVVAQMVIEEPSALRKRRLCQRINEVFPF